MSRSVRESNDRRGRSSALLFYLAVSGTAIAGTMLAAMASGKNLDPALA